MLDDKVVQMYFYKYARRTSHENSTFKKFVKKKTKTKTSKQNKNINNQKQNQPIKQTNKKTNNRKQQSTLEHVSFQPVCNTANEGDFRFYRNWFQREGPYKTLFNKKHSHDMKRFLLNYKAEKISGS